jgi:hypothetical protein
MNTVTIIYIVGVSYAQEVFKTFIPKHPINSDASAESEHQNQLSHTRSPCVA